MKETRSKSNKTSQIIFTWIDYDKQKNLLQLINLNRIEMKAKYKSSKDF